MTPHIARELLILAAEVVTFVVLISVIVHSLKGGHHR